MICGNCKNVIPDGQSVCNYCGTPVAIAGGQQVYTQQGYVQPNYGQPVLTKKEFYKHPNMKEVNGEIRTCGIVLYVLAGINLAAAFALGMSSVLDVLIIIAFGLAIHLAKSRVASILLMVFAFFNVVVTTIMYGRLGGWWYLLIAYAAITNTFKLHKAWQEYQRTGIVPYVSKRKK